MGKGKGNERGTSLICPNCGGQLEVTGLEDSVECQYCGSKFASSELLEESEAVRIEKIKQKTYKDVEGERLRQEAEKSKKIQEQGSIEAFKKSKFSKVLVVFAIIALLLGVSAFKKGAFLAGIVAVVMAGLFITSFLMGLQVVKEKKKGIRVIIAVIAFVLIIPFFSLNKGVSANSEKIKWSDITLGEKLPEPKSNVGQIIINSDDSLSLTMDKTDKSDYKKYVEKCEEKGYTVEADKSETNYSAFNAEGYGLDLFYLESSKQLQISLDAPIEMGELVWPSSAIASTVPAPKSTTGDIGTDKDDALFVKVGKTTLEDYNAYVQACSDNGYNVNHDKGDKFYHAENTDGYKLSLTYIGADTMTVDLKAPEEEKAKAESTETAETSEKVTTEEKNKETSAEVTPSFKETMDSYEAFIDEYIAFMKKYNESTDQTSMLTDFTDYMAKYTDAMEKINAIDEKTLSPADDAYYLEVQTRVTKKLAEASL